MYTNSETNKQISHQIRFDGNLDTLKTCLPNTTKKIPNDVLSLVFHVG